MVSWSPHELIAAVLARQLRNGWRGVTPYSPITLAACVLARRLHAPGMTFWAGTLGVNPLPEQLYRSGTDPRNLASVEAIGNFYDVFEYGETGCDFMFYSGLQIDRYGNANNLWTGGGETGRPIQIGTGQANTSHPVVDGRFYLYAPVHTPEVLVERVDVVSVAGFLDGGDARAQHGLPGGGPEMCVTELAVLDFDPIEHSMRIASVHPGVRVEEVRERTGFELPAPPRLSETQPPSEEELRILRELDRDGLLR